MSSTISQPMVNRLHWDHSVPREWPYEDIVLLLCRDRHFKNLLRLLGSDVICTASSFQQRWSWIIQLATFPCFWCFSFATFAGSRKSGPVATHLSVKAQTDRPSPIHKTPSSLITFRENARPSPRHSTSFASLHEIRRKYLLGPGPIQRSTHWTPGTPCSPTMLN